jgi:hypothetical protein
MEHMSSEPGDDNVILCFWLSRFKSVIATGTSVDDSILRGVNKLFNGSGSFSMSGSWETKRSSWPGLFGGVGGFATGTEKGKNDVRRDESAGSVTCLLPAL